MDYEIITKALARRGDKTATDVFRLLILYPQGMTRAKLVAHIFEHGYSNPNADRTIRKAIKRLRDLGLVIISSTDKAGYRLAGNDETKTVKLYALQQYKAAVSRMATAKKVLKAYGLKDNLSMKLGG